MKILNKATDSQRKCLGTSPLPLVHTPSGISWELDDQESWICGARCWWKWCSHLEPSWTRSMGSTVARCYGRAWCICDAVSRHPGPGAASWPRGSGQLLQQVRIERATMWWPRIQPHVARRKRSPVPAVGHAKRGGCDRGRQTGNRHGYTCVHICTHREVQVLPQGTTWSIWGPWAADALSAAREHQWGCEQPRRTPEGPPEPMQNLC